jgi:hypothetical protein
MEAILAIAEEIRAELVRINKRLDALASTSGRRISPRRIRDPGFAKELRGLLAASEMSQSDLAAKIWDRYTNTEGKFVARGRDRISKYVNGHEYPSKANLQKIMDVFNLV